MDQAAARIEGAGAALKGVRQSVMLDAVSAYANVLTSDQSLRLRQAFAAGFDQRVAGTRRQVELGVLTRTDLAQTLARQASARAGLLRAQADAETAHAIYAEVVGQNPLELEPLPPAPETPLSVEAAQALALHENPLLEEANQGVAEQRALVRVARGAGRPNLSLDAHIGTNQDDGGPSIDTNSNDVRASLTIPLFSGGFNRSRISQANLEVSRAEARAEQVHRQVARGVAAAWNEWNAARQAVEQAQAQRDASALALQGLEREREMGLRTVNEVLDANDQLLSADLNLNAAQKAAVVSAYTLLAAIGVLNIGGR